MPLDDEDVRLGVYEEFATTGRAPTPAELGARFGAGSSEVQASLRRLSDGRHVVLGDGERIVMAHPFSAVPLGFSVMGSQTLWWGGCAWDSFALPHLLAGRLAAEPGALVATRCPACGRPHAWVVGPGAPPSGDQVAHFLVPVARMWDDVVRTCDHQRLFCDEACVDAWVARSGQARGYVMDVPTLWRLAAHWYDGRLDRGYVRRDPTSAAAYFREVGLTGEFWGL
ncbi:MAG: organomercurial lyase [Acidimicrobiales bacterium]